MQITYNTSTLRLDDMPLGIGYASEKVEVTHPANGAFSVGGQNGFTQLIVTAPFVDDNLVTQLREIDTLLSLNALEGISKTMVVAHAEHSDPQLEGWRFGIDTDEAFGDYYGVRFAPGELGGEFTKALLVISKDGALFYDDIPKSLHETFSLEKAIPKIAAATNCYTGKGCH